MARDARAPELASLAAALAAGHGVELPASLSLWRMAGGRPGGVAPRTDPAPWHVLGRALEARLSPGSRRRGAHYTPPSVAASVAQLALPPGAPPGPVVDPACGGGALLLEIGEVLGARSGSRKTDIARSWLWGADIDPMAVAVAEAAVALWSGGIPPTAGHLAVDDTLSRERVQLWPTAPPAGFAAVVGNPPFQGQLARETMRDAAQRRALRHRFGPAAGGYTDTATVFLLVAAELAAPGARVAMIQPQSTAGARHAQGVRAAIGNRGTLLDVVALPAKSFTAEVDVCVVVLEVGDPTEPAVSWSDLLAAARGVPSVDLAGPTLGSVVEAVAGFRQHYYELVGHVHELVDAPDCALGRPLVTCGSIGIGASSWGARPTRFAKRIWERPVVDVDRAAAASPRVGEWFERMWRPKVLVASQTRVTEAVADHEGGWLPGVPAIALLPQEAADADRVTAVVCAPPVAAWAARRASGTGLSADSIRVSSALLLEIPLPPDASALDRATELLVSGDLDAYGGMATEMYHLAPDIADDITTWWSAARRRR